MSKPRHQVEQPSSVTVRLAPHERQWLEELSRKAVRKPSAYLRWLLHRAREQEEAGQAA